MLSLFDYSGAPELILTKTQVFLKIERNSPKMEIFQEIQSRIAQNEAAQRPKWKAVLSKNPYKKPPPIPEAFDRKEVIPRKLYNEIYELFRTANMPSLIVNQPVSSQGGLSSSHRESGGGLPRLRNSLRDGQEAPLFQLRSQRAKTVENAQRFLENESIHLRPKTKRKQKGGKAKKEKDSHDFSRRNQRVIKQHVNGIRFGYSTNPRPVLNEELNLEKLKTKYDVIQDMREVDRRPQHNYYKRQVVNAKFKKQQGGIPVSLKVENSFHRRTNTQTLENKKKRLPFNFNQILASFEQQGQTISDKSPKK